MSCLSGLRVPFPKGKGTQIMDNANLSNKGINTHITYWSEQGFRCISDVKFTEVVRVTRNERLVYTKRSIPKSYAGGKIHKSCYQKLHRREKLKTTSISAAILVQAVSIVLQNPGKSMWVQTGKTQDAISTYAQIFD